MRLGRNNPVKKFGFGLWLHFIYYVVWREFVLNCHAVLGEVPVEIDFFLTICFWSVFCATESVNTTE